MSHKPKAAPAEPTKTITAAEGLQQHQVANPIVLPKKVEDYSAIADFLAGCKSPFTAKGYKTALNKFFNFAAVENKGFDPDVAITMRPEELNPIVLKYAMHLKKVAKKTTTTDGAGFKHGEISVNSVMYYLSPIKTFFDNNDISLSWKKIMRYVPEETVRHYHVYSKDEIKKMLAVANHRERVILLVLLTSGMRAQALVQLQIRDFEVLPDNVGHFVVYARTRDYYHTFCTPECTSAIRFYLNWRQEMGEEIRPEAPLIRDSIKDAFSKKTKTPKPISYIRLWEIMQKLLRKANISNVNLQPNHSFRKFMNTVVANAKANPLFKEIMLGHSLKLDNMYYDRDDPTSLEALHQKYLKAVDYLTINDEYRLKRENQQIKQRNEELERGKDEVQRLRAELEPLMALKDVLIKEGLLKEGALKHQG
jgi:integrase